MPKYKNKDEYILWLAGFIERITTGGEAKLPPISKFIPPDFKFNYDELSKVSNSTSTRDDGEMIVSYFKSDAFTKIIKEEK